MTPLGCTRVGWSLNPALLGMIDWAVDSVGYSGSAEGVGCWEGLPNSSVGVRWACATVSDPLDC